MALGGQRALGGPFGPGRCAALKTNRHRRAQAPLEQLAGAPQHCSRADVPRARWLLADPPHGAWTALATPRRSAPCNRRTIEPTGLTQQPPRKAAASPGGGPHPMLVLVRKGRNRGAQGAACIGRRLCVPLRLLVVALAAALADGLHLERATDVGQEGRQRILAIDAEPRSL